MNVVILVVYGVNLLLFLLALLWILVPALYGLPSKPTKPDRIRKALQLVDLKLGKIALELPFHVLLVHRRSFKSEEAAQRFIRRHYKRFPAFTVCSVSYMEGWKGNLFQFPAQGSRR